jgi:hypothetical protein
MVLREACPRRRTTAALFLDPYPGCEEVLEVLLLQLAVLGHLEDGAVRVVNALLWGFGPGRGHLVELGQELGSLVLQLVGLGQHGADGRCARVAGIDYSP